MEKDDVKVGLNLKVIWYQGGDQWRPPVNVVISLRPPQCAANFLTF
jgi:hypothetical protein